MGANKPRRNHYNPEWLLNNFCDIDGRLWLGDKYHPKPFRTSPVNVFVVGNLYTTNDHAQSVKTFENEEALARIESDAKPAISIVIDRARRGCPSRLSPEDNNYFKRFIFSSGTSDPRISRANGPICGC